MVVISDLGKRERPPRKEPVMKKILRISRSVKVRRARVKEIYEFSLDAMEVETKAELIQALIPTGLWYVKEVLEQEVKEVAGD
jgi:hypothetical protein